MNSNLLDYLSFPEDNIWLGNEKNKIPPYIFNDKIKIALQVALVTRRPLLVTGSPGCGKTTLARVIAAAHGASYLSYTFTSRSRLEDLTGEIDQLQRLHDAHAVAATHAELMEDWCYYKPGLFWWGFDPESAKRRGGKQEKIDALGTRFRIPPIPKYLNDEAKGVVLLMDEIDKAEPDLPNDLLEPLDNLSFNLPGIEPIVANHAWYLVIITSNGERELPPAFLRRCVTLDLPDPNVADLVKIAEQHLHTPPTFQKDLYSKLADKFINITSAAKNSQKRPPGTSEYLDAIKACMALKVTPDDEDATWQQIAQATLLKTPSTDE
jgi:MoxR-like ATPase